MCHSELPCLLLTLNRILELMQYIFIVEQEQDQRLDAYLAVCLPNESRTMLKNQIKSGAVVVNDVVVTKPAYLVQTEDKITLETKKEELISTKIHAVDLQLQVLYEDGDCFVLYKPLGVSVHPGHSSDPNEVTLLHGIAHLFAEHSLLFVESHALVHRLDKNTTGCILVAKHKQAYAYLQSQFQNRTVNKTYLAIVHGVPKQPVATINAPIGRSVHDRTKMSVTVQTNSRSAQTGYSVLTCNTDRSATLVECKLYTGRTHQIRVHMASIGHPLVADTAYETKQYTSVLTQISMINLHAYQLEFFSEAINKTVTVQAALPKDFIKNLELLSVELPSSIILADK
jgi:23S rRNA pseudouridine1911/1915/1917 synthase